MNFHCFSVFIINSLYYVWASQLYAGRQLCQFRNIESNPDWGFTGKITTDFHLYSRLYLTFGVMLSTKKGVIEDFIAGGTYSSGAAYRKDIHYIIVSVHFPVFLLKGRFLIQNSDWEVMPFIGQSMSFSIVRNTKEANKQFVQDIYNLSDWEEIDYDYDYAYEAWPFNGGLVRHMGIAIRYRKWLFEFEQLHDNFGINTIGHAETNGKLNTCCLTVGIAW